ncbi:MAG: hypothetical protein JO032_16285 [Alphaproteobacteria bacterium]|nr:hypothetical protein [Alphaproteobacteria bacterium]MBV9554339.1 hypothetical protein [Alphaproteobacteria bacterium]
MPPVVTPLPAPALGATSPAVPVAPSAEAIVPPAAVAPAPAEKRAATAEHPAKSHVAGKPPAHHVAKFTALLKRLAPVRPHPRVRHFAVRQAEPSPAVAPPPGYYLPPGPYERLVYGGPPRGFYRGWRGYPGSYPDYP